ncbi:MAG: tungsten formylmethanofuran dehydrogenase, partial [Ignavibacteria bacterium]
MAKELNENLKTSVKDKSNGKKPTGKTGSFGGLTVDQLLHAYRLMVLSRTIDEKVFRLIKQGKGFFHLGAAGHEAAQIAFAQAMKKGVDWAFPYYRDLGFMIGLETKTHDIFLHQLCKAEDPMTGGRQMPCHWGSKEFNVPTQSSPTGTQFLQAVGTALANRRKGINAVTYVSSGEGTTSEGEFFEAVNWASREKLPVVFVIQNNKYAISVPVENQNAGKNNSVAEMMKGFENLYRQSVDGTDYLLMNAVAQSAFNYARQGKGPALIEANCVRLFSHSASDDQNKYRSKEEIEADKAKDPILKYEKLLLEKGAATQLALDEIKKEIKKHVDEAADWALSHDDPDPKTAELFVLDESGRRDKLVYEKSEPKGKPTVMVDAINHALREEMERNDKIYIFGEDVADKKGGVFTATKGLSTI